MGLISRVSSRTYRDLSSSNMAKGARNKKRQKARNERRKKFAPREIEKLKTHVPDLETLKAATEAKSQTVEGEMEIADNKSSMTQEEINSFDCKTKRNKEGNYAPWLSGRDVKRL